MGRRRQANGRSPAFAVPGGDLIGQAIAIDGDTIEIHSSTFGFGPSTHRRLASPGITILGQLSPNGLPANRSADMTTSDLVALHNISLRTT
jgi:hypothetical protein